MPSTRDIRRRIKSVKSTAQITKAMQMVASSKMLKAQQGALNFRPFGVMSRELMSHLALDSEDYQHPLMELREVRQRVVILVSTDKGLCGGLNANLFREVSKYDLATTQFIAVGKKAAQFLARTRRKLVAESPTTILRLTPIARRSPGSPRRCSLRVTPTPWTCSTPVSLIRSRSGLIYRRSCRCARRRTW